MPRWHALDEVVGVALGGAKVKGKEVAVTSHESDNLSLRMAMIAVVRELCKARRQVAEREHPFVKVCELLVAQ